MFTVVRNLGQIYFGVEIVGEDSHDIVGFTVFAVRPDTTWSLRGLEGRGPTVSVTTVTGNGSIRMTVKMESYLRNKGFMIRVSF